MFTDIEGSTVRWDRDPAAMQAAVRRHDTLMRAAIDAAGGFVFKTVGDAFCAVFARASEGLDAALRAQRALAAEDFDAVSGIRVRMALHLGASDERDDDYFGPTLNRVARLLAIGHGSQVLLSEAAALALADDVPAGVTLRDLGRHSLKDLSEPEHVFQVDARGLPSEFPALRSLSVANTNLPRLLTSFVGRERDVDELQALVRTHRFVTVCGSGGIGKTRCTLQATAEMIDDFADGVWLVDLARLHDAGLVANAIAAVFGVREPARRTMLETLVDHLRGKKLLLVLDNCEHLIDAASATAAALLSACPNVHVVATSRESLNVPGEVVHRVAPMRAPQPGVRLTAARAREFDAVALFEARARASNKRFALTDDNAAAVAEICARLDGIPLAIELAAARIRVLSVQDLASRLDERFRILTGGDRTAVPRQQTLRAAIDWSYDTLPEPERAVFRAVSIFVGGFTLQTATAVCDEALDEFDVIDHVTALVDKSLLMMEHSSGDSRYRLLESTRAYAREKLEASGELHAVATRHADAYAARAEQHELNYETTPLPEWLAAVEYDLENVRAALRWSFGPDGVALTGQRIAATLGSILVTFAASEARRWVATALERVDRATPALIVARLELAGAFLASVLNQFKASLAAAERALAGFEEIGDSRGVADAQRLAGRSLVRLGRIAEAEPLLQASLATHQALGSRRVGGTLRDLAVARAGEHDLNGARELFGRALAVFRRNADEENVALTAAALAEAEFACGDAEAALPLAEEALNVVRGFGRDRMAAALLGNIAAYLVELRAYDLAQAHAREALRTARTVEAEVSVVLAIQHLAAVAALRPEPDASTAAHLLGFVDGRIAALELTREYTEEHEYEVVLDALRAAFDAETLMTKMNDGRTFTAERAIELALAV